MASYKYKVIKGGKVIGEATTRAEAEAAAKKFGGHVAEIVADKSGRRGNPAGDVSARVYFDDQPGATPGWVAEYSDRDGRIITTSEHAGHPDMPTRRNASAAANRIAARCARELSRRGNPGNRSDELPENRVTLTLADGTKVTRTEYGKESDIRAFSMASSLGPLGEVYRKGDPRGSDVLFVDIMQTRAPITKPNPPLEPHSATTLLDAVKPGAPQQIHGVKVARVGAGYSVDGKSMTRAQALKALEAGRTANPKAKTPKSKPTTAKASGRKIQYV